jgi:hypothetical protein
MVISPLENLKDIVPDLEELARQRSFLMGVPAAGNHYFLSEEVLLEVLLLVVLLSELLLLLSELLVLLSELFSDDLEPSDFASFASEEDSCLESPLESEPFLPAPPPLARA